MSETISSGITVTIPTLGEQNWDQLVKNSCITPISSHNHTGGGSGVTLGTAAIQADAITGAKIRLANNENLRGRNAANNADINILKINSSDKIETNASAGFNWTTWTPTLSGGGSMTYGSTTIDTAFYVRIFDLIFFGLSVSAGTTGGVANSNLVFTLPVATSFTPQNYCRWQATIQDGAGVFFPGSATINASTTAIVGKDDGSTYGLGTGRGFYLQGWYRI